MNALIKKISADPNICFGKPCIKGTRIWVSLILDMLSEGVSFDEIIKEYPVLSAEDIRAAIAYGAEMTRERIVDIKPDVKAA
jgi:uncharacterized protein (DUF433 family)